jgi:PAS domain S-box-containing protein
MSAEGVGMKPLPILYLEDRAQDVELVEATLAAEGVACTVQWVETGARFRQALAEPELRLILSDYALPGFDGLAALQVAREQRPELPFIFVSGAIGEERAIESLKQGATDYVLKQRLTRLGPVVRRALQEAAERTERKRVEAALRESEARFRRSFELGLVGMAITSPTKELLEVNDQFCKLLGYERSELVHMTWEEVTHPDDLAADIAQFNRVLAGECDGYALDKRFIRKDSQVLHATISTNCLRRADGVIDSFVALLQDISKWKETEEALRENEERYRLVSQVISDYAFSLHFKADGSISYDWLTESFTKITGYEVAEVLGKPNLVQRYVHPDDLERLNTTIRRLPPGAITSYEFRLICRDGSVRWLRSYAQPLFDAHGQLSRLYGATQDITERKRDEEEKRKLQEQLFQAQKLEAIGTLAGGIAHDFNNILTIILVFSELLKEAVLADPVAQDNLEEIYKAGNRAKELVQQLLAFSRPEQQARRPVDLHVVVVESLRLLRAVLPTTIAIRSSLASSGAVVLANATQLHQVLMNLGVNALHAMQDTGGVLEVRLEPTIVTRAFARSHPSLTPGAYCQLTVRDTGCGMTSEIRARIFDPFFTTKPVGEGSGLGLSVIHGIVSSYGGTVTVDSTPGQGTTFVVYLPQSTEAVASPVPVALPPRSKPGRVILFVDDEQAVAQMAHQMLKHLGYEAVVTTSSHEALDTFRHRPGHFDVVVTDQTMPGLTGDQLARELLALRPELPIILCTGFSPTLTEEKAKALGIRAYLRKPLSTAELGRALEDIFASREES